MGLAIVVGMYSDLLKEDPEGAEWLGKTFNTLNDVLKKNGIETFNEPKELHELRSRSWCDSFPYSFIHYLRRFYAYVISTPDWVPAPVKEDEDPASDPVVEEETLMFESHLLCHSDCEGFYLPIRFDEVIFDENKRIPGGMLGSSYKLLEELVQVAPRLNIKLTNSKLSDEEAERINKLASSEDEYYREYCVWIALYEAARLSIENKTVISFC
ncbi:hypothetical protein [Desulfogranum japonicum]|uniref:hypothetical protein n=1 Tax=Desulfogranum japonicum TaxID=231447 RepID=UPI00042A5D83|nr:hypothetical protein [Desulfogranum japonicum]